MAHIELWFLRHGDAEDENPDAPGDDAARRLTPKGEEQARAAAGALAVLGRSFAGVLTSPRVRAQQTAAPVGRALGLEPMVHEPLAGGFDAGDASAVLLAQEEAGRTLLVGHEPDFSALVEHLTGAEIAMKKGGLAAVRFNPAGVDELIVLLRPSELAAMTG